MRLVQHQQGIHSQETGLVRPHPARHAIAFEQQSGADHVDGADHDRGSRRVFEPVAVVRESAAQGRDGQLAKPKPEAVRERRGHVAAQLLCDLCRLVHHDPPVDHVHHPPWHLGTRSPCEQPQRHDGGLAESGGDVHRGRQVAVDEASEQTLLPAERPVPGQLLEGLDEVEGWRVNDSRHALSSSLNRLMGLTTTVHDRQYWECTSSEELAYGAMSFETSTVSRGRLHIAVRERLLGLVDRDSRFGR